MKAKRNTQPIKISNQSIILTIILTLLATLVITMGDLYQVPSRFTLPLSIVLFWVSGSIAVWNFRKRSL